ncbi:hypothetical protein Bca52824_043389 [Brassica carinata]|uniref:F-box domain-containing protein n=1 Tax=Brassica carinata TaxID=52824 RepID=A0A8X7RYH9_BRACI|nr:hypothetical protein Bca52824_043389 [Brassica carinata]
MKSRRQNLSVESSISAISRCSSRSPTSTNGRENSEPIPADLIFELLLRLPAKSIARCRCVSSLWSSILIRPDFTELFFTRSSSLPQLLLSRQENDELLFFTAPQVHTSSLVSPNHHKKIPFLLSTSQICGHLRGLICLTHQRTVKKRKETVPVMFNPSTGESLELPKVKTSMVMVRSFFAYDPVANQFKVLSMSWPCYKSGWICKDHQVLTLGTGNLSWRMVECSIPHHPTYDGICINGCLYYQAIVDRGSGVSAIICFDVRSEKFSFIKKAQDYKGRLGILTADRDELTGESRYMEMWLLVDAEKHEWSRHVYVFPSSWGNVAGEAQLYYIGMSGNNEVLLSPRYPSSPFYVFYYNFERGTIRRVEIQRMDALKHGRIHTFLDHVEDVKLYANV